MSRIAVMLENDFEDSEYSEPAKAFKEDGHELIVIGLKQGAELKGKKHQTPVKVDRAISEISVSDFDALFIPGGYSPDRLRAYPEAVEFTRDFMQTQKPVFAICHAAQLLISAQALEGRKVTGWKSVIQDIKNAGAQYIDQEVVEDGNLVSSRQPSDIPAFIEKCLRKLHLAQV